MGDLCVSGFSSLDSVAGKFVVTADKNSAGNLEIISWSVNTDGSLTKIATFAGGAVGELAITTFQQVVASNLGLFVTAITTAAGDLQVASWRVLANGTIQQLASATAGAASHPAIIDIATDMVATTCITGSGVEKVITWRIA